MDKNPIGELMQTTMDNVKNMLKVDIVVGVNEYDKIAEILNSFDKNDKNVFCSDQGMPLKSLKRTVSRNLR